MKRSVVLDTHILIAYLRGTLGGVGKPSSLLRVVTSAEADRGLLVSAATFWEIELIRRHPRNDLRALPATDDLVWLLRSKGVATAPITPELAVRAVRLLDEGFHKDPMDQFITATAIKEGSILATRDRAIRRWAEENGKPELAPMD
ncbi:MAG: type II toxin-antitoxin system VapC family toxin [bacterium]|nr:type II toxin-antitoxin system VapC family toxin [bacterium]